MNVQNIQDELYFLPSIFRFHCISVDHGYSISIRHLPPFLYTIYTGTTAKLFRYVSRRDYCTRNRSQIEKCISIRIALSKGGRMLGMARTDHIHYKHATTIKYPNNNTEFNEEEG